MSSFRARPRFVHKVEHQVELVQDKLKIHLESDDACCKGVVHPGYVVIRIPEEHQHFWSPQLNIRIEEGEDGTGAEVHGRYGPRSTVWAMFFYGYAIIGILAMFLGMFGLSQWMLDQPAYILWTLPALGAIALILYISAQTGQKLGAEQMFTLHHFYEEAMGEKVHIS